MAYIERPLWLALAAVALLSRPEAGADAATLATLAALAILFVIVRGLDRITALALFRLEQRGARHG